jgi:hypothetical protein
MAEHATTPIGSMINNVQRQRAWGIMDDYGYKIIMLLELFVNAACESVWENGK